MWFNWDVTWKSPVTNTGEHMFVNQQLEANFKWGFGEKHGIVEEIRWMGAVKEKQRFRKYLFMEVKVFVKILLQPSYYRLF